jgi:hypothetical protein
MKNIITTSKVITTLTDFTVLLGGQSEEDPEYPLGKLRESRCLLPQRARDFPLRGWIWGDRSVLPGHLRSATNFELRDSFLIIL